MDYSNRTYHEVIRGTHFGFPEKRQYPAGYALRFVGTDHYLLKLWFQQEGSYYIKTTVEKPGFYGIFGKKEVQPDGSVRLLNPIGYAKLMEGHDYLEIMLPDLPHRYYMSLHPKS